MKKMKRNFLICSNPATAIAFNKSFHQLSLWWNFFLTPFCIWSYGGEIYSFWIYSCCFLILNAHIQNISITILITITIIMIFFNVLIFIHSPCIQSNVFVLLWKTVGKILGTLFCRAQPDVAASVVTSVSSSVTKRSRCLTDVEPLQSNGVSQTSRGQRGVSGVLTRWGAIFLWKHVGKQGNESLQQISGEYF